MKKNTVKRMLFGVLTVLVLSTSGLKAAEYFLRADTTTLTLPNGSNVVMWGFARDSSFGALDGVVTVPGPQLTVLPNDSVLTIHLDNRLPEPVSIVIPGQTIVPVPVRTVDGRARSFTTETSTSNAAPVNYVWSNLRPGTFLYQSGTHPSVQVQMGLYGCVRKNYASGQAYPGVSFDTEITLLYSEIDTVLHDAVATGQYGPTKTVTSTVNYAPKYFMINGRSYTNGMAPISAGLPGDAVMIHFLNAGLETHVPIVNNAYLKLVAEDGFKYPYPKDQYSVFLPAGKTIDALFTSSVSNVLAVYDRRLDMMNATTSPGGMLTYLSITNTLAPLGDAVAQSSALQSSSLYDAAKRMNGAARVSIVGDTSAVPEILREDGSQTPSTETPIATATVDSWPQTWSSSDWSPKHTAINLVDGDTNTVWVGKDGGATWAVSVDFGVKMKLTDLQILFWGKAWKSTFVGGSVNGTTDWFDVTSVTNSTIDIRYLLIEMWNDPTETTPPAIREIIWK